MSITQAGFHRSEASGSRLRLQTAVRLRWFGVIGQLVTVCFVYLVLDFPLPFGICLAFIALSAWLNVFLRILYPARTRLSTTFATGLLAYDIVQLAALLYLTGGISNPFTFLLVAPVTVSAATLPPRITFALGLLAGAATVLLVFWRLPLPWYRGVPLDLPMLYNVGLLASVLSGTIFLALYAWRLAKESRQMADALAATEMVLAREQQLHALDGLAAAAAHELGTPLSTIAVVAKELNRDAPQGSQLAEDLALLQTQALRCREILKKLTRGPTEPDPLHARMSVTQLIDEAASPYRGFGAELVMTALPESGSEGPAATQPVGERRPGVLYGLGNLVEKTVVCNADPKRALHMLSDVPAEFRTRLEDWKIRSPVVKLNTALSRLPEWTAAPGERFPAFATIDCTGTIDDAQRDFDRCTQGEAAVGFGEIYIQTGYDPSPAPPGKHLMSVFGQYAPYDFDWATRKDEVAEQFFALITKFAPDFRGVLEHYEVLGPPDIEQRIGLTSGNIFQGETMPDQMWEHRLSARTPIPGFYFCGAATHPAGSVIALNGRNAAMAVLEDAGVQARPSSHSRIET
jgi:two-component system sensor histidine kinase RegB